MHDSFFYNPLSMRWDPDNSSFLLTGWFQTHWSDVPSLKSRSMMKMMHGVMMGNREKAIHCNVVTGCMWAPMAVMNRKTNIIDSVMCKCMGRILSSWSMAIAKIPQPRRNWVTTCRCIPKLQGKAMHGVVIAKGGIAATLRIWLDCGKQEK